MLFGATTVSNGGEISVIKGQEITVSVLLTGTGAVSASYEIQSSGDGTNWVAVVKDGVSGTSAASEKFVFDAPSWRLRAVVTAISGTGAALTVLSDKGDASDVTVSPLDFGAVGDGSTDDTTALQSTFTAAAALGVPVMLPPRTFRYTGLLTGNCSIIGSGPASYLKHTAAAGVNSRIDFTSVSDIVLRDFKIGTTLADGTLTSETEAAFRFTDCSRVRVTGVHFSNMGGSCTLMRRCQDSSVIGNIVEGNWKDTFHTTGGVASGYNNITIANNVIEDAGDDVIAVVGYDADTYAVGHVTISGNTINGTKSARGITVVGGRHVTITGNTIFNAFSAGIYIASESSFSSRATSHVIAQGNIVTKCGNSSPDHGAVHVSCYASRAVSHVKILNNIIQRSANNGIFVFGVSGTPVQSIDIVGNSILDNTDPDGKVGTSGALNKAGISATAYVSNINIDGNRFNEIGNGAIFLAATMGETVRITNNTMSDLNKNGAGTTDAINVASSNTAKRIFIDGNSLTTQSYTLEAMIECQNAGITEFGKNHSTGVYGVVHGLAYTTISPGGSPHTYTAASGHPQVVQINGGTVSAIDISFDGTNFFSTGRTSGVFNLNNGSRLKVTYTGAPTQFVWSAMSI